MNTNTRLIPLTQGKFAIVDEQDYDWLMQWKWCAHKHPIAHGCNWYAVRNDYSNKRTKTWYMHTVISNRAGFPDGKGCDHRDRNGLNNTRKNLRPCTPSQQQANRRKFSGMSSKYKGVCWARLPKKWKAGIKVNGVRIHLGYFNDEETAGKAYSDAAKKHFGEFACY